MHLVILVDVEEYRPPDTSTDVWLCTSVMLLTPAVVLLTPHDYNGTVQEGYSARFTASRGGSREQEGLCTLKNNLERTLKDTRSVQELTVQVAC